MASSTALDTTATFTRSVIGPLTTTFTPPPECSVYTRIGNHLTAQTYADLCAVWWPDCRAPGAEPLECLPSSTGAWNTVQSGMFYSPAYICPEGWRTVATASAATTTEKAGNKRKRGVLDAIQTETLLAGESAALCCPSGYHYSTPDDQYEFGRCQSEQTSGTIAFVGCQGTSTTTASALGMTTAIPEVGPSIFYAGASIMAPAVQINWRAQDLPTSTTSSLSTASTSEASTQTKETSASTKSATTAASATPSHEGGTQGTAPGDGDNQHTGMGQNNGPTTGLSTGAKIGVALAASLTTMLGCAAFIFFWLRWRKGQSLWGWWPPKWLSGWYSGGHIYGVPGQGSREDLNGKDGGVRVGQREVDEEEMGERGRPGLTRLETIPEAASYLTRSAIEPDADEEDGEDDDEEDLGQGRLIPQEADDEGLGQWRLYEHR